jgi:hypothetical protein
LGREIDTRPNGPDKDIASVLDSIELVKTAGFGEVRIMIRNGAIYRILKTEDRVLGKE